jgi:cell wall-associated NlpC family hydrolase
MRYIAVVLPLFLLTSCGTKQLEPKAAEEPIEQVQVELSEEPKEPPTQEIEQIEPKEPPTQEVEQIEQKVITLAESGLPRQAKPKPEKQWIEQKQPKSTKQPTKEPQHSLTTEPKEAPQEELSLVKIITQDNKSVALYAAIEDWLGVPYKTGGASKRGVDCSALVGLIYREVYGKILSRTTSEMFKSSHKLERSELQEGDLVFFHTRHSNKTRVNHMGIYLKDGNFVHASLTKGVIISSLDNSYYKRTWTAGGKVK